MKHRKIVLPSVVALCILLTGSFGKVSSEKLQLEEGKVPAPDAGLYFPRPDQGYLNLRIAGNQWVVIFLNPEKEAIRPEKIKEVIVIAESVRGEDDRENYLLNPDPSGLFFSHPRFIEKPYQYQVKVLVKREEKKPTPTRGKGFKNTVVTENYGFTRLSQ